MLIFTFFVSCQLSSWLLTAANVDRLLYVVSYTFSKKWCQKRTTKSVSLALLASLSLANAHFLFFVDTNELQNASSLGHFTATNSSEELTLIHHIVYPRCHTKPGTYSFFYTNYYTWLDSFVYSFVPFIIMTVCNTTLIHKVFRTKRNLKQSAKSSHLNAIKHGETHYDKHLLRPLMSANQHSSEISSETQQSHQGHLMTPNSFRRNVAGGSQVRMHTHDPNEKMRYMALTITGVTFLFILFTVPVNIYNPILNSSASYLSSKCDDLLFCVLNNMVNCNHSINFIIYLFTNKKFKKEMNSLLGELSLRKNGECILAKFKMPLVEREKSCPVKEANGKAVSRSSLELNSSNKEIHRV